jgi:uncharacterized membrane protein YbjE (DUF340 family)
MILLFLFYFGWSLSDLWAAAQEYVESVLLCLLSFVAVLLGQVTAVVETRCVTP